MNLRYFESILGVMSEKEIEELQVAKDKHRSRRLGRDGEDCLGSVKPPVYSPKCLEKERSPKSKSRVLL
jgi:hypothetical protein